MAIDARTLRERRKQRIAARTATAESDMPDWLDEKIDGTEDEETDEDAGAALGAFQYNPVYQKPTNMGADKPSGGYHYYGPLPDAGTSYGYYVDEDNDLGIISVRQAKAFSPVSGKPMKYQGKVGVKALASLLAASADMVDLACGNAQRYCSAPLRSVATSKLFDVLNGKDITASLKALAQDEMDEEPDLDMDDELEVDLDLEGDEAESMDEEMPVDEELPMDEPMEFSEDEEMPMDDEMSMGQDEPEMEVDLDEMGEDEAMEEESEDMESETDEPMVDDLDQEIDDLMAEYDMSGSDDEDMDDMAPMDEGAGDEMAFEDLETAQEDMDEGGEESEEDESMEDESLEDLEEAVTYEALMNLDELDEEPLSEADVHMTLFNEQDALGQTAANPYWNIDIKGMPVARVFLQDQPKPEEIRRVFCSADYHRGVSEAIEKAGLLPVLQKLNAKIWANKVEETKLAQRIRRDVEAQASTQVKAVTKNLMRDLLHRIALVCAGMDKNFYHGTGNPLKEALWGEFHRFGIANPSPMIEAAFRRGSTQYFETVIAKAVEYMEMEPKALAQLQKAIGEADVLSVGGSTVGDELPDADTPETMPTLSQRLAASSVALGGIPALAGDALGDHKRAMREELRLGGAGPVLRRR